MSPLPFGITACERLEVAEICDRFFRFKRLSASLHVKVGGIVVFLVTVKFQTPFGITACERFIPKSGRYQPDKFQTPFGITACESDDEEKDAQA